MFEYVIYFDREELNKVVKLKQYFEYKYKDKKSVFTMHSKQDVFMLLIAVDVALKEEIMNKITSFVIEFVDNKKKQTVNSFFNNYPQLKCAKRNLITNMLCCFDSYSDKMFVINEFLQLDKSINLNSFYLFKIYNLKMRWFEYIKIALDNLNLFSDIYGLVEFTKFLLESSKTKNTMKVNCTKKYYVLEINNSKFSILKDYDAFINILSVLVKTLPNRLVVKNSKDFDVETLSGLRDVMQEKLLLL